MAEYLQGDISFRGHHLMTLTDLMPPINSTPEYMAYIRRATYVARRGDITAATVNWQALTAPDDDPENQATYAYDLVGETTDQADRYENTFRGALTTFVTLDEDASILLTSRRVDELGPKGLDGICKACTFMQHCHTPDEEGVDTQYLDLFSDMLFFTRDNNPSLDIAAIRTPEGNLLTSTKAVRRVITIFAMGGKDKKDHFYDDALGRQKMYGSMLKGPDKAAVVEYYERHHNKNA